MAKCVGVFMEGNSDILPVQESLPIAINAILAELSLSMSIKGEIRRKVNRELE